MLFSLSLRNVKRSFQDYFIYFLTLTFAVCLFYTFNSIGAQTEIFESTSGKKEVLVQLLNVLNYVTIFIAFVLAFLILFANQFLIKRRKKEFGTYMTLGMGRSHISRILISETLVIGIFSLVIGLILGIVASQGMSRVTASLFDVTLDNFNFVFSTTSFIKTIIAFSIIFGFVMLFNTYSISRYELIDLIHAGKKNEKQPLKNSNISGVLFLISIILLITGYVLLTVTTISNIIFVAISAICMLIGTFLFFFSLANFMLSVLVKRDKIYLKGLNLFVVRQLTSKVNTTFLSISIIALMLTFTIVILSTGFGYKHSVENELKKVAPFDATIKMSQYENEKTTIDSFLKKNGIDMNQYGKYVEITSYRPDVEGSILFAKYQSNYKYLNEMFKEGFPMPIFAISQSDYKSVLNFQGKKPVNLKSNEVIFITNIFSMEEVLEDYTSSEKYIEIGGEKLPFASAGYDSVAIETENVGRMDAYLVLPDNVVKQLDIAIKIANINYTGSQEAQIQTEKFFSNLSEKFINEEPPFRTPTIGFRGTTKAISYETVAGETTIIIFVGIYLGIIFLISSAAILALQQLSEASDNTDRFKMLGRIGVTQNMLHGALFKQIVIYFLTPLSLALLHSLVIINFINKSLITSGTSILIPSLVTLAIFLIVYGAYFLVTYAGVKRIIR